MNASLDIICQIEHWNLQIDSDRRRNRDREGEWNNPKAVWTEVQSGGKKEDKATT